MNLSIVPNFDGKLHAKDRVKGLALEFRAFPAIELTIALVKSYPSHRAPLIALKGSFYQRFKSTVLSKITEIWAEDCPAIYEMVMTMQGDLLPVLMEEYPDELVQDDNGDITIEFENAMELESGLEEANSAFRRQFNSEE